MLRMRKFGDVVFRWCGADKPAHAIAFIFLTTSLPQYTHKEALDKCKLLRAPWAHDASQSR